MTFIAALASGPGAAADLRLSIQRSMTTARVTWAAYNDHAVVWLNDHPWVSSHDDGEVLVVLDGQLHNLLERGRSAAALLHGRYQELGDDLGRGLLGDFV